MYIYRNNLSDHNVYSLQICFLRQDLNPQETSKYKIYIYTYTLSSRITFSLASCTMCACTLSFACNDHQREERGGVISVTAQVFLVGVGALRPSCPLNLTTSHHALVVHFWCLPEHEILSQISEISHTTAMTEKKFGSRVRKIHTWYLSILIYHHIIMACKRPPKACKFATKWPKLYNIGQKYAFGIWTRIGNLLLILHITVNSCWRQFIITMPM